MPDLSKSSIITIESIRTPKKGVPSVPDSKTLEEEKSYEEEEFKLKLRDLANDIEARKRYANRIFWLIVCWLIGMFAIMILQGFGSKMNIFELSEQVLMSFIGGTTVNILGIFVIVVNYLFKKPQK